LWDFGPVVFHKKTYLNKNKIKKAPYELGGHVLWVGGRGRVAAPP